MQMQVQVQEQERHRSSHAGVPAMQQALGEAQKCSGAHAQGGEVPTSSPAEAWRRGNDAKPEGLTKNTLA